jgi:hypothetical protein
MLEMLNKKIWANFQRIIDLFTQKIVTKLSKIWVWDPGSEILGIRKKTYSGSRIQGSKRHRIPDPDPQHCLARSVKLSRLSSKCIKLPPLVYTRKNDTQSECTVQCTKCALFSVQFFQAKSSK